MKVKRYRVQSYSGDVSEYEVNVNGDRVIIKQYNSERVVEARVEKIDDSNYIVHLGYDKYRVTLSNSATFIDREIPLITSVIELPLAIETSGERREKVEARRIERGAIKAPLSGKVESIKVRAGDRIKVGDVVLTMISMKMRVEVKSDVSGAVEEILVKVGDAVKTGDVLMRIRVS